MKSELTPLAALELVIYALGGTQESCASQLGTTQPTISRWLNVSRRIPAEMVLKAEGLSGVSRHDLRPDLYPRDALVDRGAAARFTGVDRRAANRPLMQGEAI